MITDYNEKYHETSLLTYYRSNQANFIHYPNVRDPELINKFPTEVVVASDLRAKIIGQLPIIRKTNKLGELHQDLNLYLSRLCVNYIIASYHLDPSYNVIIFPERWYPSRITRLWKRISHLGKDLYEGYISIIFFVTNYSLGEVQTKTEMDIAFPMF